MFGLHKQAPVVRYLAAALAIVGLSLVLLSSLMAYLLEGAGQTLKSWIPVGVALGACCLASAFFFQRGRRWALAGVLVFAAASVALSRWVERQALEEAALLRVGVAEPDMDRYRPVAGNTRLARLDGTAALQLPRQNLPRLDGATALYPLYAAFVAASWPELDEATLNEKVRVSKTPQAYERLFAREADIIFVAKPSRVQSEQARAAGLDLQLTPIGREAFVFYVADQNPVTGLSQQQIRDIYAGKTTRWNELGGGPGEIRAFQRPAGSGSQSMLEKIMGDTPLMAAPTENLVQGMGGVVQQTSDYINYPGAIGYSFRVFVTRMLQAGGIRLLAVDGVAPTEASIADGSYPFAAEFYAATLGPPTGETRRFIDWMRSPEGQLLVQRTGYVAVK